MRNRASGACSIRNDPSTHAPGVTLSRRCRHTLVRPGCGRVCPALAAASPLRRFARRGGRTEFQFPMGRNRVSEALVGKLWMSTTLDGDRSRYQVRKRSKWALLCCARPPRRGRAPASHIDTRRGGVGQSVLFYVIRLLRLSGNLVFMRAIEVGRLARVRRSRAVGSSAPRAAFRCGETIQFV
jgi:hypothetical protein